MWQNFKAVWHDYYVIILLTNAFVLLDIQSSVLALRQLFPSCGGPQEWDTKSSFKKMHLIFLYDLCHFSSQKV